MYPLLYASFHQPFFLHKRHQVGRPKNLKKGFNRFQNNIGYLYPYSWGIVQKSVEPEIKEMTDAILRGWGRDFFIYNQYIIKLYN